MYHNKSFIHLCHQCCFHFCAIINHILTLNLNSAKYIRIISGLFIRIFFSLTWQVHQEMLPCPTFPPTLVTLSKDPKPGSLSRSSMSPPQALEVIALANTEDSFIYSSTTSCRYLFFRRLKSKTHYSSFQCPYYTWQKIHYKYREKPDYCLVLCAERQG